VVDKDELERRVLAFGGFFGGARGAHDHPFLRGEGAAGLELRHPFELDEAHAARADGRSEARLVAEHRDLDAGRCRRLDHAGSLRHLHGPLVDRDGDEVGRRLRHAGLPWNVCGTPDTVVWRRAMT